ncbi:nucleoside kinase [Bacteroides propionicifaciens]|uniref:nucleoside kinase n=1 Tax=Bacteroides propionicifaciens TaxID=392838 RepID=UPI000381CFD0|nr:nucleoside kinase [Bacteroides propionicifaciens]
MKQLVQIYCKNNNIYKEFPIGSSLLDIYRGFKLDFKYPVVSAKVNNRIEGLRYRAYNNKDIDFLDATNSSAMRTYVRSLSFVLYKAITELFPEGKLFVEHPVSKGYFCNIEIGREVQIDDIALIKVRMQEIIDQDLPFYRKEVRTTDAIALFEEEGMHDKVKLLKTSGAIYTYYYELGGTKDYYYGSLLPSTGALKVFDLIKYYDGVLLRIPNRDNPFEIAELTKQEKMFSVFKEYLSWQRIMGVRTVGDMNIASKNGHTTDLINVAEALQEKKIAQIADEIHCRGKKGKPVRAVLISGPSSSGKTTFSKRLSIQLMTNGLKPVAISLDNYFVERDETPKDENGDFDYESLYALDLELFDQHLQALIRGEKVELPSFNFQTGKKEYKGDTLQLKENMILILEGIHALNPSLTEHIKREDKYMVYVSALTTISLDDHNWIPTTDNRLLRRIVRDYNYRGYSAEETISRWKSVRAGEDKWIFPYQENADAMFNSALIFELAVIRRYAEPILMCVPQSDPAYSEAYRLLKFLNFFYPIQDKQIPPTSLLREFLGGSSFEY